MKQAIFLSASIPDPQRKPEYADCDPMAFRDAIIALATETARRHIPLVFGGHPSITALLARWAERKGQVNHVELYQSRYFEKEFPPEVRTFPRLHLVDRVAGDLQANLTHFRQVMLQENPIALGVFMGGMDGLQEELDLLRQHYPEAVTMPLMHLGGQTRDIFSLDTLHPLVQEANAAYFSPSGRFAHVLNKIWEK
ncbi:MAG: hypothetical protein HQL65_04965 [Magnetococcales bacterium]|nr:hypothetical protein [Magnetococcales bacterium]